MARTDYHEQVAALCYRIRNDTIEILLIKSQGQGRWILPKGWPMKNKSARKAALTEAYEEAGVEGRVSRNPVGRFYYEKQVSKGRTLSCQAETYPVKVRRLKKRYPERDVRERRWFSQERAIRAVDGESLRTLLISFDPLRQNQSLKKAA